MNGLISAACSSLAEPKNSRARPASMASSGSMPKLREQHDGGVHRDDHHLAVREVDDAHDAEDHRQPERHQPVDQAGEQALGDCLREREKEVRVQVD